jgi:GT2 family glycosyltransferase
MSSLQHQSRLSVVIVDHRRPDLLADALRALHASSRRPDEIIVVNVESVEPLAVPDDLVRGDDPSTIHVLDLPDNPGYAAACNRGLAVAAGDRILFMNADVFVTSDCLGSVLAEIDADASVGVATCRLVLPDGRLDHACHRGIPSPFDSLFYKLRLHRLFPRSRRLSRYTMSWLDTAGTHDVEACSGAFLMARRDTLDAVGGWDERYWFYAEDLDLCLRVAQAGMRVRYVGSASATHVKGASSHIRRSRRDLKPQEQATRRHVQEAIVDSHELFYREHLEAVTSPLARPLVRAMFALQRLRLRATR